MSSVYGAAIWVPSDRTGVSDMAAELESFVATNYPNQVFLAPGSKIRLRSFGQRGNLGTAYYPKIDFGDCEILQDNDAPCIDINNAAQASAEVDVSSLVDGYTADGTPTTTITLASTLGVQAHNFIAIYSDDANPSVSGGKLGEIVQVIADETGLVINTARRIYQSNLWTTNVKVRKLPEGKLKITGGVYKSNGDSDDLAVTTRFEAVRVTGFIDPEINGEFKSPWESSIVYYACARAKTDGFRMYDSHNNGSVNGFNYGVVFYGMNDQCVASNMHLANCRHPAGSTSGNTSNTDVWYLKGYPTKYTFSRIEGHNCYGTLTDSHEQGAGGSVVDVTSYNPVQDRAGTQGLTHQSRALFETISNVRCIGGMGGVKVSNVDHGVENHVVIDNCVARDVENEDGNSYALHVDDFATTGKLVVHLSNFKAINCDRAIRAGENTVIKSYDFHGKGNIMGFDMHPGSTVYSINEHQDFTNSRHAGSLQYPTFWRSAVGSEPTKINLGTYTIIQNATNEPRELNSEADTNANKNVYHEGVTLYQPNGGTAMLERESGSTTFVNATGVSTLTLG